MVRAGALGDVLLLRRAVHGLKSAGHSVSLLAPAGPGSALVGSGPAEVEGLLSWDRAVVAGLLCAEGVPPGLFRDALSSFDAAIAYTRSRDLARGLSDLVPHVVSHDPTPPTGAKHASDWLAEPAAAFGAGAEPRELPVHQPTTAEREAASDLIARLPARFLAIHPGSGSRAKNWPADRFAALARSVSQDRPWLLVEGPAEAETTSVLRAAPGVVIVATLPPRVLGAILATAGLYIGNDSGVSHLAAAWGAPTVALFGPTDAALWSPIGPSVVVIQSSDGSMDSISPEKVLAVVAPQDA